LTGTRLKITSHSEKQYKWCEDGVERWCTGQILSVVDRTHEWLNVQYDGEEDSHLKSVRGY